MPSQIFIKLISRLTCILAEMNFLFWSWFCVCIRRILYSWIYFSCQLETKYYLCRTLSWRFFGPKLISRNIIIRFLILIIFIQCKYLINIVQYSLFVAMNIKCWWGSTVVNHIFVSFKFQIRIFSLPGFFTGIKSFSILFIEK